MAQPNWGSKKGWQTGKAMTLLEAFGISKEKMTFPNLKPQVTGPSAAAQHPINVGSVSAHIGSNKQGGSPGNVKPGSRNFAIAVLKGIGAPATAANVRSIEAWVAREGGGGKNNPLNTTEQMPGSTTFNSVGVQNYPSPAEGVAATVKTLNNGLYGDLLQAFDSGKGLLGRIFTGLSRWSGNGYNSVG